jgi:dual specificity tyrosine-phosphorylation-regulated kinase 2/3/4
LDSYHTKVSPTRRLPESESYSYLRTPSSKDPSRYSSHYLQSPSTPGPTDPSTLNRDDLVGVGELTTPRWKSGQTFPPTSNSAYEQSQQRVAPDTISKSGRVKASLFPSRRTKSIANSESYNSLVIEDRNPPVPSLPGSVTMPHTATLGGTLGRHGSGRVQGPRMRIPSGPAQRIVSGTQQDPDQRDDEQHRATNDRSTVSVNAALYGQATNRESGPDTMSSARVEQPGTPSRSSLRVNTSNGSPGSPYGTLKSNRRYSAKIAADLQALKVREANQSADRITLENNREALAVETATPVSTMFDIPFTGTTGSAVSSPKRFNQADVPGVDRPRLTSGNSTERTPSRSAKGEARRTPPAGYKREPRISFNQGRHSNDLPTPQAILKQLGSHRDFSHLPPSPSSASINKFMMRESASTNSFSPIMSPGDVTAENPVSGTGGSYPFPEDSLDQRSGQTKTTRKRKETNDDQGRGLDQETVDVLRKLDGLGKASSSSLKKQAKQDDGHVDNELAQAKTLSQRRDQGVETKRGRPEMTTPSSPAISKSRGTSASSSGLASSTIATAFAEQQALRSLDNAGASIANLTSQEGSQSSGGIAKGDVPPVPPLPNGYQSPPATIVKSPTLGSLPRPSEYALIKDDSSYLSPLASQANVERNFPTSASSPLLGSEASFRTADSKSPAMSSFSVFEPSGGDAERPRRMSKKWSFSSALSLGSHSQKSKVDPAHSTIASECSPQADEFGRSPSDSLPAHSGLRGVVPEDRTSIGDANAAFSRSGLPNVHGENNLMVPNDSRPSAFNKRSTSSGIPFFRRSSSSSSNAIAGSGLTKGPHHAGQEQPSTIKDPNNRKTILGVSMSLLKGSSSRRNLQRQPSQEQMQNSTLIPVTVEKPKHERKGSLGWARRKGKVRSVRLIFLGRCAKPLCHEQATEEPPVDLSNNSFSSRPSQSGGSADSRSIQRKASQESTAPSLLPTTPGPSRLAQRQAGSGMQLSRSGILPSIAGSPAIQTKLESGSPSPSINHARNLMSTTPTKIPRMTSKTSLVNSSGLSSYAALSFNKPVGSSSLPLTRERTVTGPPAVPMSNMAELGLADKPRYGTRAHLKDAAFELPRTDQSAASAIPSDINMHDRKASMHISNAQKRVLPLPPNDIDVSTATKSRVLPRDLSAASVRRTSLSGSQMSNGAGASPASTPIKADKHLASRLAVPAYSRVSHSTSNSHLSARSSRSQSPQSSMDEDELIGDKEMSTFFRQQQIKQSRGEIKSAEIEAMLNFPDPMGPGKEMTPHGKQNTLLAPTKAPLRIDPSATILAFIKAHFESLSLYERREILDYQSIWYSGQNAKKNQATPESTHNNHGYDDERGDYIFIKGDHLAYRYEIMCLLGKGSFGQVLQCRDHKTGQCVAIKIIRNKKRFHHQALVEIKILENLVKWVGSLVRALFKEFRLIAF